MEKKFTLGEFGPQLWTRDKARPIRSRLGVVLESLRAGDVVAIDASGVEVFDFSFAAELFGKTLLTLGVGPYAQHAKAAPFASLGISLPRSAAQSSLSRR